MACFLQWGQRIAAAEAAQETTMIAKGIRNHRLTLPAKYPRMTVDATSKMINRSNLHRMDR
jgi:hypothetical protein